MGTAWKQVAPRLGNRLIFGISVRKKYVLYCSSEKKDLETLNGFKVLREFAGTLTHDHETAMYHFGNGHSECNVHLKRYLLKNTEETGNKWSQCLGSFLEGMNQTRKEPCGRRVCRLHIRTAGTL